MPIAQAGEMVQENVSGSSSNQRQQAARIRQHDPHLDDQALRQIAALLQQSISPLVAIEALDDKPWAGHPRHQSESLLCDISGVAHLFGGEIGLLKAANGLLATRGLSGRMAIADAVGTAWAMSHYGPAPNASQAQDASEHGFIAPPGQSQRAIASLPVEALRIWPDTVATLSRLGIESIGQLLRLPRGGLATRLGHPLVRRIEQGVAEVDEPIGVYRPPAEDWASIALEYSTSDQKILADRIERLTKKVRAGLATRQRGAQRITCRLDLSAHPPLTFEIGLFAPTIDADHLSGLMINRLESMKLSCCVERITVSVTLSGPLRSAQVSLFGNQLCDGNGSADCMSGSSLSRLVDSLSGRLGRDAVLSVKLEEDPLPENAFSVSPLAGNIAASGKSVSSNSIRRPKTPTSSKAFPRSAVQNSWRKDRDLSTAAVYQPSPGDAMRRPLSLLAEPIPLAVAFEKGPFCRYASSPRLPSRIHFDGVVHQIARDWGPERIETGWWKGPSIRRDYYRIETDQGRWWWIYRNLVSKAQASDPKSCYCWMLHGRFT
jgi:protein ImuB